MAATGNVELGQGLCVPEWVMEVVILEPFRCGVEVWIPPTAPPRTVPEKGKRGRRVRWFWKKESCRKPR